MSPIAKPVRKSLRTRSGVVVGRARPGAAARRQSPSPSHVGRLPVVSVELLEPSGRSSFLDRNVVFVVRRGLRAGPETAVHGAR